jgi:hypothetical protein
VRPPWERALDLLGGRGIALDALRPLLLRWLAVPGVLSAPPLSVR